MSFLIYLTLEGKKQGLISSGCSTQDSIGNRYQSGHDNEIQILSLNHSLSRSQNTTHHPVQFTKPIDKSSPLLTSSIDSNELMSARFTFYRTSQSGQLEKFYEIKLSDASVTEISCVYPNSVDSNECMPFERIQLNYTSISWGHLMANTSSYSICDNRVF